MSRIGKQPINIPSDVSVEIKDRAIVVRGPKGELDWRLPESVKVTQEREELRVYAASLNKKNRSIWGTARALIANMVEGVKEGYQKNLEIYGVGYRAALQGNKLVLNIGFSHPVEITAPEGITFAVEKNVISVSGIDKVLVGEIAAKIRSVRKPEPYKGKGIRYQGEFVKIKPGKKAAGAA